MAFPLAAGFSGRDVIIPASARIQGSGTPPAQFYSTLWVTNLSTTTVANANVFLFRLGQANPSPQPVPVTIAPGETKKWENVLQTLFGLTGGAAGAIRIVSNVPVLASSRTFDRPDGTDISQATGLFFGAIPASFAIRQGESAILQGVSQGSAAEDYRYNFGLVETTGNGAVVTVTLRSSSGGTLASTDYSIGAREAKQVNVATLFPGIVTDNARLEATVSGGTGAVLFYGTLLANGSQDSAGFEMSFRESLLVEGADTSAANLAVSTTAVTKAVWEIAPRVGITTGIVAALAEIPFTAT